LANRQRIITDNKTLQSQYDSLASGDIIMGGVRLKPFEEHILLDLVERGVRMIPSAQAQLASRSKVFQTRLFVSWMIPHTRVVYDLHDIVDAISVYARAGVSQVVSKHDHRNAGRGVHLWASIEDIYTQASFGVMPFPFVVQPFVPNCLDIRVVILDDYLEAYKRENPYNFRKNLHSGGKSSACELAPEQKDLCRQVMERGRFPYAHIDILVTGAGTSYLGEINLRGGIRGAGIKGPEYREKIAAIHEKYLKSISE